jgi:hypothetical protein
LPAQTRLDDGGELKQNKRNNTSWYCPEKCLNRWRWTFSSLYWSRPHSFQSLQCFFLYWLLSWRPELLKPQKNSFQWTYEKINHSIAHITLKLQHKQTQQIQNHSFTTDSCFELVYRLTFLMMRITREVHPKANWNPRCSSNVLNCDPWYIKETAV